MRLDGKVAVVTSGVDAVKEMAILWNVPLLALSRLMCRSPLNYPKR